MPDDDLKLHELNLRLYKGIVHAWEAYAMRPEHAAFRPVAALLRDGADAWAAYLRARRGHDASR